jgi:hypothetical protein
VGLRKLLARKQAEDPLERLAALGREHHPTPQFAELATRDEAAPIRVVSVDKKVGEVSVAESRPTTPESKKAVEVPRSRSGYVWVSQRSRAKRAAWADFTDQTF